MRSSRALALLACCLTGAASAGELVLDFDSNPAARDLVCPPAVTAPPKPRPPRPAGTRLPAAEVLAALGTAEAIPQAAPDPALLTHFRLDNQGTQDRRLRVAVWGDSHAAAGGLQAAFQHALAAAGLASEQRAMGPTAGRPGVALPVRKHCLVGKWQFEPLYLARGNAVASGPGLANLRAVEGDSAVLLDLRSAQRKPMLAALTVLYAPPASEVELELTVDGGAARRVTLPPGPAKAHAPGRLVLRASRGLSTLRLRVLRGPFVWQGAMFEPLESAPVQLDVFAFPSATVRGWAQADVDYLRQALPPTGYDAVVLQYGTNEANAEHFDSKAYADLLAAALGRLRAVFPEASCVLVGPTDRGVPLDQIPLPETGPPGRAPMPGQTLAALLRYSEIHRQITEIQAETAARYRCAAWNWQAFMGGRGGAYRWSQGKPRLGADDLIHLTPEGYRRSGLELARWLGWTRKSSAAQTALQSGPP